jgi:hypothetical protein
MAKKLTSRGRAMRWLTDHRHIEEQPAGSNWDRRDDGIAHAIRTCGFNSPVPWCGVWHYMALRAGGVKGISSRQASVSLIEDDARAHRAPYGRGWGMDPKRALRGDAVVLFGRGVHVETVRSTAWAYRKLGLIRTEGGNTTSGNAGDQANGGGSFPRYRRLKDVHGFAYVNFPNH